MSESELREIVQEAVELARRSVLLSNEEVVSHVMREGPCFCGKDACLAIGGEIQ